MRAVGAPANPGPPPSQPSNPSPPRLPPTVVLLQFVRDVAEGILPSWEPIVERRRGREFTQEQRDWQLLRRGR